MKQNQPLLETVPVTRAIGMVLGHDLTEIIPESFKGRSFQRGHIIREEDIEHLLRMGKEQIYVLNPDKDFIHEDEAAQRIARAVCGTGIEFSAPSEGRVNMLAARDGLLKIDTDLLEAVNILENIVLATVHTNQQVHQGRPVAGTRIIPLMIHRRRVEEVERICSLKPVIRVMPFQSLSVGVITTGSEVYSGRVKDGFGPVLKKKFSRLGCRIFRQMFVSDNRDMAAESIHELIGQGVDMVVLTGGMSVDPDDVTPSAIRTVADQVITYGSPAFPGAMFMLAYKYQIPVIGLPGCVMYHRASIFDLIIPRLLAGDKVTRKDIVKMGHGGFCAGCSPCRYPVCPFGKG